MLKKNSSFCEKGFIYIIDCDTKLKSFKINIFTSQGELLTIVKLQCHNPQYVGDGLILIMVCNKITPIYFQNSKYIF